MVSSCLSMSAGVAPLVGFALYGVPGLAWAICSLPVSGAKTCGQGKSSIRLPGQIHLLLRPDVPKDHDGNDQQRHRQECPDRPPQPSPEHQRKEYQEGTQGQALADDTRRDEMALERC